MAGTAAAAERLQTLLWPAGPAGTALPPGQAGEMQRCSQSCCHQQSCSLPSCKVPLLSCSCKCNAAHAACWWRALAVTPPGVVWMLNNSGLRCVNKRDNYSMHFLQVLMLFSYRAIT